MEEKTLINESILKEWSSAVYNSCFHGNGEPIKSFKEKHREEYKLITAMYRKRVAINETLDIMEDMNEPIYWFTLTFNNDKDSNLVETKRKDAEKFLNSMCQCYLMVEEYGEDNGRYHIHGFLCFKYGFGFVDFTSWHSRQKIELLNEEKKKKKKVRYLTKYAVKSVPRIRRSKTLSKLYMFYRHKKVLRKSFYSTYLEGFKTYVASVVNPF